MNLIRLISNIIPFLFLCTFTLCAQEVAIEVDLKLTNMSKNNQADSVVVRLGSGILAVRDANTINTYTAGSGIAITNNVISANGGSSHHVGELFGGGVVFFVYDNGLHGLISGIEDLDPSSGASWYNLNTFVLNTDSAWNGAANTAAIIAAGGSPTHAAGLCDNYSHAGFTDWYLPARWELDILYSKAFILSKIFENDTDPSSSGLRQGSTNYWSSTQKNATMTWVQAGGFGHSDLLIKTDVGRVRPIRSF